VEHRVERARDQVGAVVQDLQIDAGGQRAANLLQLLLGGGHHAAAVFTADHHHHAGDDLPAAVAGGGPLPHEWRDLHGADVADQHRHAPRGAANDHLLDVFDIAEQRLAADEPLLAILHDVAAARARVVAFEGGEHLAERDAVRRHPIGVDLHLVALGEAAVAVDVGDARHGPHHRRDVPLEDAAELHRAHALAPQFELQDLPERRRERAQLRIDAVDGHPGPRGRQPFGDELTGPENVGTLAKDDRHQRDAEAGDATGLLHVGQAAHGQLDGVGDEPLHLERRQRAHLRHDLHLDVDEVRNRIDGDLRGGVETAERHEEEKRDDHRPVGERPLDDA